MKLNTMIFNLKYNRINKITKFNINLILLSL